MEECPHCLKSFVCLNKHLHRCKVRTVDVERDECLWKEESNHMEQCPHCAKSFKCLNKHLPRCTMKKVDGKMYDETDEESDSCRRKDASNNMEQCAYCAKSFKCLNKHLPHCKLKTVHKESDEEIDECLPKEESSEEEQCPQCAKMFKCLKIHLPLCEMNKVYRESDGCRQNEESDKVEECPHCLKPFERLRIHQPKCKLKNVEKGSDEFRRKDIEDELNKRLRKANVDLRRPDDTVTDTINKIKEIMLKKLNATNAEGLCLCWKAFSTGSYYEILKIDRPDEFDLMFTCKIDCDINYDPEPETEHGQRLSRQYCALKAKEGQVPSVLVGNDGWLCPKAFHKYFHDKVDEFTREYGKIELERGSTMVQKHLKVSYSGTSPAVTLEYTSVAKIPYSIDLVPAIEFDHFPEPAKNWDCSWIPKRGDVKKIRQKFHVVAKIQQTELVKAPGECRLWRLSFSAAEKNLLVSADGKYGSRYLTCRKDVLRLLKLDLSDFYETRKDDPHEFPTYNLKMLMLNLFEKLRNSKDWVKDTSLLARYTDALRYWKTSIAERQLPHYFIEGENMLQDDGKPKVQLPELEQWVTKCLGKYEFPKATLAAIHSKEC